MGALMWFRVAILLLATCGLIRAQVGGGQQQPILPGAPPTGLGGVCTAPQPGYFNLNSGILGSCQGGVWATQGGVASVAWGAITGTLSAQTDLNTALNARLQTANNLSELTATAAAARTNLGLGTAATQNTGTTGATLGLLSTSNTYAGTQTFNNLTVTGTCTGCGTGGGGLGDPAANGIVVRTALNTTVARTLGFTAGNILITNPDGVAAAPSINTGANVPLINTNNTFTGTQSFNNLTVTGTCTGCGATGTANAPAVGTVSGTAPSLTFTGHASSLDTINYFTTTLTANVTTATCAQVTPNSFWNFQVTQGGAGGFTLAGCTGWDLPPIDPGVGIVSTYTYQIDSTGVGHLTPHSTALWNGISCPSSSSAPPTNYPANTINVFCDSSSLLLKTNINNSGSSQFIPLTTNTTTALNQVLLTTATAGYYTAGSITNAMLPGTGQITLNQTANQVLVSVSPVALGGATTLSLPQNIHTAATPTFASETLTANTNQLIFGTTNTTTLTMASLTASRTFTLPNANSNPVQGIANPADSNCVQWIATDGTQNRGPCGATGANTALSNLAAVSVNQSLTPQTTLSLGDSTHPWQNLYLYGPGTYGANNVQFTTASLTAARTFTLPDANSVAVRPITTPGSTTCLNFIDSTGVQQTTPCGGSNTVGTPYDSTANTGNITSQTLYTNGGTAGRYDIWWYMSQNGLCSSIPGQPPSVVTTFNWTDGGGATNAATSPLTLLTAQGNYGNTRLSGVVHIWLAASQAVTMTAAINQTCTGGSYDMHAAVNPR